MYKNEFELCVTDEDPRGHNVSIVVLLSTYIFAQ